MQTQEFLQKIRAQGDQPLLFQFATGQVVQGGYHVTEIKNAGYETIDCGNSLHSWKEVIIQVWVPSEAQETEPMMPSDKFLKIWDVVDSRLSLHQDAEIRIEFGDENNLTSIYHVDGIVSTKAGFVVQMAPPRTMCKPREILIEPNGMSKSAVAESCCSTPGRVETIVPLTQAVPAASGGCCSTPSPVGTIALSADAIGIEVSSATPVKQQSCC